MLLTNVLLVHVIAPSPTAIPEGTLLHTGRNIYINKYEVIKIQKRDLLIQIFNSMRYYEHIVRCKAQLVYTCFDYTYVLLPTLVVLMAVVEISSLALQHHTNHLYQLSVHAFHVTTWDNFCNSVIKVSIICLEGYNNCQRKQKFGGRLGTTGLYGSAPM